MFCPPGLQKPYKNDPFIKRGTEIEMTMIRREFLLYFSLICYEVCYMNIKIISFQISFVNEITSSYEV